MIFGGIVFISMLLLLMNDLDLKISMSLVDLYSVDNAFKKVADNCAPNLSFCYLCPVWHYEAENFLKCNLQEEKNNQLLS